MKKSTPTYWLFTTSWLQSELIIINISKEVKMSRKREVLITGGAGFIGSHIQDRCLAEGDNVTVVDNLVSGKEENL